MDPETYEVTNEEQDDLDSDDLQKAEAVEIDFVDALRTAEDEGGAEPEDAELDDHNDTIVWEIELVDGTEVYVDVTSGDVVETDS
ncbi:PepSY domain-containing protein [Nesterenkonia pannonica]|nr:PepSY domain-containing protein [Nesterenkonia pannonica]